MAKNFALRAAGSHEFLIRGISYIGSSSDCLIRYNDPAVSPHHAKVWVAQDALWLIDENSFGGVLINGWQVVPSQTYQLQPGDRVQLGTTAIELVAVLQTSPAAASRRLSPLVLFGIFGCVVALGLGLLTSAYFIFGRNRPGLFASKAKIISTSIPEPLLKPQEFADTNQALVQAVAALNQSELAFIQAARATTSTSPSKSFVSLVFPAPPTDALDEKLLHVAADAMHVATLSESLSQTAAAQDSGSAQAGQIAAQYGSMAKLGAAEVIDTQNLRSGLAQGSVTKQQAAATVADYGARLWNPAVSDPASPGNPFSPYIDPSSRIPASEPISAEGMTQLSNQAGLGLAIWVANSLETTTKKLSIPYPIQPAGTSNDPAELAKLSTAAGQVDASAADGAAASMLEELSSSVKEDGISAGEFVVTKFYAGMVAASQDQAGNQAATPARNLPAFPTGTATIVSKTTAGDIMSNLLTLDSADNPTDVAQIPVKESKPLVILTISNISIDTLTQRPNGSNTFEADVTFSFDVKWTTNVDAPQFTLNCVGNNNIFPVTSRFGSQHVIAKSAMILYPGVVDAYCYATLNDGNGGNADVRFLVGDPAGATQRAQQVEADAANLDLQLTADKQRELDAKVASDDATKAAKDVEDAVSTEVSGTQTAEFRATITQIARLTEQAVPQITDTPSATPTFVPVLVESFAFPGNLMAMSSKTKLQRGRLYQVCMSGFAYTTTGAYSADQIMHINGARVPPSGCLTFEGSNAPVAITCGGNGQDLGESASDPGAYDVKVFDLGPN